MGGGVDCEEHGQHAELGRQRAGAAATELINSMVLLGAIPVDCSQKSATGDLHKSTYLTQCPSYTVILHVVLTSKSLLPAIRCEHFRIY